MAKKKNYYKNFQSTRSFPPRFLVDVSVSLTILSSARAGNMTCSPILLVPSINVWHKVVTRLSCGRINVEQSSPHIHIKQCPKPFPVWSGSSSTITLEQYSNFFTVDHKEIFAVLSTFISMGSLLFMPGYCEKIDIWHLKRKDTMIQVKKKKKKRLLQLPVLGVSCVEGS